MPFTSELVKQNRLEEVYEIFRRQPGATDMDVAMRLARFAEAHIYNAAEKRIAELERQLAVVNRSARTCCCHL